MNDDNRQAIFEDRLLRRARSYRAVRIGASYLFIFSFIGWLVALRVEDVVIAQGYAFASMWIWACLNGYAHARLDHIATIRHYRALIDHE